MTIQELRASLWALSIVVPIFVLGAGLLGHLLGGKRARVKAFMALVDFAASADRGHPDWALRTVPAALTQAAALIGGDDVVIAPTPANRANERCEHRIRQAYTSSVGYFHSKCFHCGTHLRADPTFGKSSAPKKKTTNGHHAIHEGATR